MQFGACWICTGQGPRHASRTQLSSSGRPPSHNIRGGADSDESLFAKFRVLLVSLLSEIVNHVPANVVYNATVNFPISGDSSSSSNSVIIPESKISLANNYCLQCEANVGHGNDATLTCIIRISRLSSSSSVLQRYTQHNLIVTKLFER